jgi:hypothetical protein
LCDNVNNLSVIDTHIIKKEILDFLGYIFDDEEINPSIEESWWRILDVALHLL